MLEHYRFTWVTRKISWTVINIQSSFKIHLFSLKAASLLFHLTMSKNKQVFWYVTSRVLVCILDSIMNSQLMCQFEERLEHILLTQSHFTKVPLY